MRSQFIQPNRVPVSSGYSYDVTASTFGQFLLLMATLLLSGCETDAPIQNGVDDRDLTDAYVQVRPSRDGIGKQYMGREISHVMGHLGAGWLERSTREAEERTDLLIAALPLSDTDVVADIGAGTGYFSLPIAKRVPSGKVLAVDVQPEMLEIIEKRVRESQVNNVELVLGDVANPNLPAESVDLILIVDAYHEFEYPQEMGAAMADALVSGGRLVLVEYRAEDPSVPIKTLHKMSEMQARSEVSAAGLVFDENLDILPQQHILIFRKP